MNFLNSGLITTQVFTKMGRVMAILFFVVCADGNSQEKNNVEKGLTDLEKVILNTFQEVDSLLSIDNGKFWGKSLHGPVLVVDPETRKFYSNQNNSDASFKQIGPLFSDSLPNDFIVSNTAINWEEKRWSMVMQPLPENRMARNHLVIHELFHVVQPKIGYEDLPEMGNAHLDTYNSRVLLKLELEALERALDAEERDQRHIHITNALTFRNERHITPEIKNAENSLELNEGLAEYTALMLSGRDAGQTKQRLVSAKESLYLNPSFVRSFAYRTISFYGYLLSSENPNWQLQIDRNTNLTDFFKETFNVVFNEGMSIKQISKGHDYGQQQIVKAEMERENKRIENIARLRKKFTQSPILVLPFQNMKISFDPGNLIPLGDLGTVYPNAAITDVWGTIIINNECLLVPDWSKVTVSGPTKISDKNVSGDGWSLELNDEFQVKKDQDKFKIIKGI